MRLISMPRLARCLLILSLAILTLPSSGCLAAAVTAGVVGAGAAGYAYYNGAAPRDFPASMDQTWSAAQLALADLGIPVESAQRDNDGAVIECKTGDGSKVNISLEPRPARVPADGQFTRVTVRVAMFGDGPVSERILNQIDTRLSPPRPAGQQVPVVIAPATYQTGPPPLAGQR